MDPETLTARVRAFIYTVRNGDSEKSLAVVTVVLFAAAEFFRRQFQNLKSATIAVYVLAGLSFLWLVLKLWKKAQPPPDVSSVPLPHAIKGLLPFISADGELFARLGRRMEVSRLLALAKDDQIGISVVRGESGAGKTSLLQAGLAYTLGKESCIYWEAVPTSPELALLHAIRSQLPGLETLDALASLPAACTERRVLILDQFEQLRASVPEHAPVFALLERIGKAPSPHKLSVIVCFRREYTPDWLDFEQTQAWRAEQVPLNLLAPQTARDTLVTLCSEAGFSLDQALVANFIASVSSNKGISPVDIAIGVLSLANFAQQSGKTHVGLKEYKLSGGAEGLLMSYVQQKLDEIPEAIRSTLIKGLVLGLIDQSNNQRIAAGATPGAIAELTELPESSLLPWLERLAHHRIRLLEQAGPERYRLAQDRLVSVLRRLAGDALAYDDRLGLRFETEYRNWHQTRSTHHLIAGKELRRVVRMRDRLLVGDEAAAKTLYLRACINRRNFLWAAASGAAIATAASAYGLDRLNRSMMQKQMLTAWGLQPELLSAQQDLDALDLSQTVNNFGWLRSARLRELTSGFSGASLNGLETLPRLTSLNLRLAGNRNTQISGLDRLSNLSSLDLNLSGSQVSSLSGIENLTNLTTLKLTLGAVATPSGLNRMTRLKKLSLTGWMTAMPDMQAVHSLKSLRLAPGNLTAAGLSELGLARLTGLTSLEIDLTNAPRVATLEGLETLTSLTSLTLHLQDSLIQDLSPLTKLPNLSTLDLDVTGSKIKSIRVLAAAPQLTALTLTGYPIDDPAEWAPLKTKLESLSLSADSIANAACLRQMEGLTSLTLDLGRLDNLDCLNGLNLNSLSLSCSEEVDNLNRFAHLSSLKGFSLDSTQIHDLAGLEKFSDVTALTLALRSAPVKALSPLEEMSKLKSLSLDLRASKIQSLSGLEKLKQLASLSLTLADSLCGCPVSSLSCLTGLGTLDSVTLWLPLPMVSEYASLKTSPTKRLVGCKL